MKIAPVLGGWLVDGVVMPQGGTEGMLMLMFAGLVSVERWSIDRV